MSIKAGSLWRYTYNS